MSFPQPLNRTNHNVIYGPIKDLFLSAKQGKILVSEELLATNMNDVKQNNASTSQWKFAEESGELKGNNEHKSVPASVLLRKLRWSTLGLQFDWSKVLLKSFS